MQCNCRPHSPNTTRIPANNAIALLGSMTAEPHGHRGAAAGGCMLATLAQSGVNLGYVRAMHSSFLSIVAQELESPASMGAEGPRSASRASTTVAMPMLRMQPREEGRAEYAVMSQPGGREQG